VRSGATLELNLADLRQLFNSFDPAPFRERDLDPGAASYIVEWAREAPRGSPPALHLRVAQAPDDEDCATVGDAVHAYFHFRARAERRRLRKLLRVGRISLVIGLAFLAGAIGLGEFIASFTSKGSYNSIIKESFVIGGWVALWRPLEIFLYDWWPIRAEAMVMDRLATMPVTVTTAAG
jgi:hypothetical protein